MAAQEHTQGDTEELPAARDLLGVVLGGISFLYPDGDTVAKKYFPTAATVTSRFLNRGKKFFKKGVDIVITVCYYTAIGNTDSTTQHIDNTTIKERTTHT